MLEQKLGNEDDTKSNQPLLQQLFLLISAHVLQPFSQLQISNQFMMILITKALNIGT